MKPSVVLAVAAHPDDIELMMAGTMLRLRDAGCTLHYMNLCNGCLGTAEHSREEIIKIRTREAQEAAKLLGATWHPPIADDLELFYEANVLRKLAAVVRVVQPRIMLVQSPQDYMEDHMIACRLAVTAAFSRGMRNFETDPPIAPLAQDVTLYHALPWGLRDPLRKLIRAGQYVDVEPVMRAKRIALAAHASQKTWLDKSQGLDSYLTTMEDMSQEVGRMSGRFKFAEGWRRHSHLGFCAENADPLSELLGDVCWTYPHYENGLQE